MQEKETETEERKQNVSERENCAVKKRREKKTWVSGKLRPVGINGSDQQSSVVRSS
jgi:hypothetical protein